MLNAILIILFIVFIMLSSFTIYVFFFTDDFETEDEYNLYAIEEAYEMALAEKNIQYLYPYATIPIAMSIVNKFRYDEIYARGHNFKEAYVDFTPLEEHFNENTKVFLREVTFNRVKGEAYSFGNDIKEVWFIDSDSGKIKLIKKWGDL